MNTNLPTFSKNEIESLKLNELTDISNSFAKALGLKTTKRFATKPKAIKRALENQELYKEELPYKELPKKEAPKKELPKKEAPKKELPKETVNKTTKKSNLNYRKFESDTLLKLGAVPAREGTAMALLIEPIGQCPITVQRVISNFMKKYQQPRGFSSVDEKFARDYITGAIRKGHLKVVK